MTDATSTPDAGDVNSLLGAYALDALDGADRARVDAYLLTDANARAEVDDMRETAASLALLPDAPVTAPPELWDRIAQAIATDASPATERGLEPGDDQTGYDQTGDDQTGDDQTGDELSARRARRSRSRWVAPLAAVAAIAVVILAVQVVSLNNRLDRAHQLGPTAMAAAFDRAAKADGARNVGLDSESGATLARVVLLPDGTGYLKGDHLEGLPAEKTYQLWAVTGSEKAPVVVSAGVLGPEPAAVAFRASGPVRAFAVTVEDAGGVVKSAQTPVAQGAVA